MVYDNNYNTEDFELMNDDELFGYIENPEKSNNPRQYQVAVKIALQREIITEYQAQNILAGNYKVLEYNPDILEKEAEEIPVHSNFDITKIYQLFNTPLKGGIAIFSAGIVVLTLSYLRSEIDWFGFHIFPLRGYFFGVLFVLAGLCLLAYSIYTKVFKKKSE